MLRAWSLIFLVVGCSSSSEVKDQCLVETTQESVRTCFPQPLDLVTDPQSPDYGRVPCVLITAARVETPYCDCTLAGYAPVTDAQAALARDELRVGSLCEGACCDDYCFCQLLQLSGADLDYCQGRIPELPPDTYPHGFCYVEPDRGFGDPSTVERCPSTQRQLVLFHPSEVINHRVGFFACEN
jgi:hypothetical protein